MLTGPYIGLGSRHAPVVASPWPAAEVLGAARPVDVVELAALPHPRLLGSAVMRDGARVAQATEGLRLQLVVNRPPEDVVELLLTDRLRTYADKRVSHVTTRSRTERDRGIAGTGADAGRTVYATLQFSPVMDVVDGAGRLVSLPNPGWHSYGSRAIVLDERVAARASFTPRDSMDEPQWPIGAAEDLPQIIAMNLRAAGVDVQTAPIEELRAMLTRPRIGEGFTYVEAQIRGGIRASDIREIRETGATPPLNAAAGTQRLDAQRSLPELAWTRGIAYTTMPRTFIEEPLFWRGARVNAPLAPGPDELVRDFVTVAHHHRLTPELAQDWHGLTPVQARETLELAVAEGVLQRRGVSADTWYEPTDATRERYARRVSRGGGPTSPGGGAGRPRASSDDAVGTRQLANGISLTPTFIARWFARPLNEARDILEDGTRAGVYVAERSGSEATYRLAWAERRRAIAALDRQGSPLGSPLRAASTEA